MIRIEDTDLERSDPKHEKDILDELEWLGIEADESPRIGGGYGPYRQSERLEIYRPLVEKLLRENKAFYCFHSEEELEKEKLVSLKDKKISVHLCEYRSIGLEEAEKLKEIKDGYVVRFKNQAGRKITFHDLIRGEIIFDSDLIGDFSIARQSEAPLYNFAVVVDDETMQITHVVRGEDHLPNTPKQILLIEALGFRKMEYAHLPLILGTDRSKLSKRHGAFAVNEYKEAGYLPEALTNFMALLGWSPGDDREILSLKELVGLFSLDRVQKSGAAFDINKLDWMNGEYIRKKTLKELIKLSQPFLKDFLQNTKSLYLDKTSTGQAKTQPPKKYLEEVLILEQPRLKKLSELAEKTDYFFREPKYDKELLRWKNMTDKETIDALEMSIKLLGKNKDKNKKEIEKVFLEEAGREGDRGRLLWPLRAALSGKKASAGPFEIIEVLGTEKSINRLNSALSKI